MSPDYVARKYPSDLRNTIRPTIELILPSAHGVVPTDYYGYSHDMAWEVKMELQGSRLVKRRQRAQVLRLSKDDAFTYLLRRHAAIFKLKTKSTDTMYYETKGDGSCACRAVWQAAQRALVPIVDRVGSPVNIRYKDDTDRLARIRWMEGLVANLMPPASHAKPHTYIQWLRMSGKNPPNWNV